MTTCIKSVGAVTAITAVSDVMALPATVDDEIGKRLEDRAERVEEVHDQRG